MSISIDIESISPSMAKAYLRQNIETNRKPKESKINGYARDMAAGDWKLTGEAIKFANTGELIDGQNRLSAIVQSGATITMLVVRNVESEAMSVIDSGAPRSVADALTILGLTETNSAKDLVAVARIHRAWSAGELPHAGSKDNGRYAGTATELQGYIERNPLVYSATRFASQAKRFLRLPVGAIGVAFSEFKTLSEEDCAEFFERIRSGATSGKGDPFYALQRRVSSDKERIGGSIPPSTALYYLMRTWNAVREGESMDHLQVGSALSGWTSIPAPR